jgi:uncharacterized protein (TIGR00251 family)
LHRDAIKVQVTAPPVEGAANEAVRELIAKWLGISRSTVKIVRGSSSRDKVLELATGNPAEIAARLKAELTGLQSNRASPALTTRDTVVN